jgi:hypothetical protein
VNHDEGGMSVVSFAAVQTSVTPTNRFPGFHLQLAPGSTMISVPIHAALVKSKPTRVFRNRKSALTRLSSDTGSYQVD